MKWRGIALKVGDSTTHLARASVRDLNEESLCGWIINPAMGSLQQSLSAFPEAHADLVPEFRSKTPFSGTKPFIGDRQRERHPHFLKQTSLYIWGMRRLIGCLCR